MKSLLALALTLSSASAFAWWTPGGDNNGPTNTHIYSRGMTCAAVQQAVGANGAVILHYGDGLFQRVVLDSSFCNRASHEITRPFYAPTKDGMCFSGYTCEQSNN